MLCLVHAGSPVTLLETRTVAWQLVCPTHALPALVLVTQLPTHQARTCNGIAYTPQSLVPHFLSSPLVSVIFTTNARHLLT
jgi:hypothetical protein